MAQHLLKYNAERKLLSEVLEPVVVEKAAPRLHTFHEGMSELRSMQHEITQLGKFVRKTGFTPGREFQRVATIPLSVKAAVQELIPNAFEDKKTFYDLLAGPLKEYDTRGKVVI